MRLTWRDEALEDLGRIYEFNSAHSERFAIKVDRRLIERAHILVRMPKLGRPLKGEGLMRLSVTDIQYVIDYLPLPDRVSIVRIRHAREIR